MPQLAISAEADRVDYVGTHGVAVSESLFRPSLRVAEHWHATAYACLTLWGSVTDHIASREASAYPGYVCYVPPGTPHANEFGHVGARCLMFEANPDAVGALAEVGVTTTRPSSTFGSPNAWRGFRLYAGLRRGSASTLDIEAFLLGAIEPVADIPRGSSRPSRWLRRVRELLDVSFIDPPSLAALAQEANVHPHHLIRAFRTSVGCSPGEYVQSRRVARACQLLLETRLPLSRIALDLGYHDQSHFTRAFRSRVAVPPGVYRIGTRTSYKTTRDQVLQTPC